VSRAVVQEAAQDVVTGRPPAAAAAALRVRVLGGHVQVDSVERGRVSWRKQLRTWSLAAPVICLGAMKVTKMY